MEPQASNRNRKFKIVLVGMALIFIGFLAVAKMPALKDVYATMCLFLMSMAGLFFGANVWEKLGQLKK